MDGFAFPGSSLPAHGLARLPVEGVSYASVPYCGEYSPRTALRVMTGAAVPEGPTRLFPLSMCAETTDDAGQTWIEFPHDEVKPGANLRLKGEEMKAGGIVMPAGLVLTPEWIGMAASLGHAELLVRRIRVAVFSTGDELAPPQDSGSARHWPNLQRQLALNRRPGAMLGAQVEDLGILPDNPEAIRSAFLDLGSRVDFIVTSGGVGEGEYDYTSKVFAELGGGSRTITSASARGNLFLSDVWVRPDLGSSRCPGIRLPLQFPQSSTCITCGQTRCWRTQR